ncbi:MAG: hypothetical protein KIT31_17285 [Deltaproteobacteria bacterium]|nr:hypothetical protein [Deltaproteobacteria bacterium]
MVLSAYDVLEVGTTTGVTADWRTPDPTQLVHLFGEALALAGTFAANGGTLAAHSIVAVGGLAVDVSGAVGATPPAAPGDAKPVDGGTGGSGGALTLYLEDVDPTVAAPRLVAHGGQGGGGQPGDATRDGGIGGDGGTGGSVLAVIAHPARRWIEALAAAYALSDASIKQRALQQLLAALPTGAAPAQLPAIRARLAAAVAGTPTAGAMNDAIHQLGLELQLLVDAWTSQLDATLDVAGGAEGPPGVGKTDGAPGTAGAAGTTTVQILGSLDAPRDTMPLAFLVHPSQCEMVLAKAKLAFLFLDPIGNPQGVADAAALFERVRARTELFVSLPDTSDLAAFYAAHEAELGAVGAIAALRRSNAEAKQYLGYLKQGLDFFGYSSAYVPLTSLTAIARNGVTPIFEAFRRIETAYQKQFAQLAQDQQVLDYVRDTRNQIQAATQQANVDIPQLVAQLTSAATIIDGYQAVLPAKRQAVHDALERYQDAIRNAFNFDWQTLLGALGQCAFAPDNDAMYAIQAGSIAYPNVTNVTDVQGQPVRRDYLVHQVKAVEATIDGLTEGFETLDDGTVEEDDPGAAKLLAAETQIDALLEQLYGKFPAEAQALKTAIQDYVGAVIARNNQVLTYNAALTLVVQYQQAQQLAQVQAQQLNDQVLASLEADAPGLTSFVSQAYYRARAQVLEFMDLAARAYRFWALEDGDLLRDALAGVSPPAIDSTVLDQIQANFWATYTKALGDVGGMQVFPDDPSDRRGETFTITGVPIDVFKSTHHLLIAVPLSQKESASGPFLNMSNVRVTHARAYVHGAKTQSGALNLTITHTGKEKIVSPSNLVFGFQHSAIPATFKYQLADEHILLDATFELPASTTSSTGLALIGPFAYWHISVDPAYNPGLDLSGVTSVELDFRGYSQSYD